MATMSKDTDGKWLYSNQVVSKDGVQSELKTANKYLDADIKMNVTVQEGTIANDAAAVLALTAGDGSVNVTSTDVTLSTETIADGYTLVAKGKGSVSGTANASVEVTTSGWVDAQTIVATEDAKALESNEATETYYVAKSNVVISDETSEATITTTPVGFTPSGSATKYAIKANGTGTFSAKATSTAGYTKGEAKDIQGTVNLDEKTVYIAEAALKNEAANPDEYTTVTGPVLVSGSYLFIDGGMIEKQKIALKDLVPDGSNVKGKEALMYKTVTAYDNDGTLVTGTMDDAVVSMAAETIIPLAGEVKGTNYVVSGSGEITPTVAAAGYLASDATITGGEVKGSLNIPVYQGEWV